MKTTQNQEAQSLRAVENELHNSSWATDYINNISNVPSKVFELLYSTEDTANAIRSILSLLGETNKVSRVYIFEDSSDHRFCHNTFEWCSEGIKPEIENLAEVSYDAIGGSYRDNFDSTGIFFCPDISVLPSIQYEFLKAQGIVAMLQSAIMENGEFKGLIGFDDCTKPMQWTEEQKQSLIIISKIISTFLRKMRREEALAETNRKLQASLEQIKMEHQRLLENEQRLSLIMQNTSVSMWEYDIENKAILQTDSSQKSHGFQKIIPNVPESLIECGFIHPDSAQSFRDMYRKLFDGEKRAEGTFRVRKPDGSGWWYEKILYSAIPDEQGKAPKAIAISSDVTAEISDSEKMRQIVDNVPSGIGIFEIVDQKIYLRYLNDKFYTLLGNTRESRKQFEGPNFLNAIHPEDTCVAKASVESLMKGNSDIDFRYRVLNINGGYTWLRLTGHKSVSPQGHTLIYCSFVNINAYMDTLFEMQKKQALIDLAMQHTNMSTWEFDPKLRRAILSEEAQRQHNLPPCVENLPESLIESGYVHPDSVENYRLLFSCNFHDKKALRYDIQIKAPDGNGYLWERYFLVPIYDQYGTLVTSYGTGVDITEEKKLLDYYRKQVFEIETLNNIGLIAKGRYNLTRNLVEYFHSEARNSDFRESSGSYDLDLKKTEVLFEDKAESVEFIKLFDRQRLINEFDQSHTGVSFEYRRKTANGAISWCLTQGTLHHDPITKDVIFFIYSQDITEQKITQKMIDEVVHLDYDLLALLDLRTKESIVYANMDKSEFESQIKPFHFENYADKVCQFAGEFLDSESYSQFMRDMSVENVTKQLKSHKRFSCYFNMRKGDMTKRKIFQFSYLDRDSGKVLLTCVDVTEIYRKEQEKIEELQRAKVAAEMAQAQAEDANRTRSQFFANMSHDLRTPLNAVIGLTELAKDEIANPETIRQYLSSINASGKFLLNIVNDGLNLEKISSGSMTLSPQPYTYKEFINTIHTIVDPLCAAKHIHFCFESDAPPRTVWVDHTRIVQIFINLLSNAVKFTPEGGRVDFLLKNDCSAPDVQCCNFIVRDNGIGMSEAFQQRMFEPFTQEHNALASQQQGTGLGLSIVKKLVELMGGWIRVKSEIGKGTEFTVHLDMPIANFTKEEVNAQTDIKQDELLENKHILLMEDHPLNIQIAQKLLKKKKMLVTCAQNGQVGVDIFASSAIHEFDAILMDIRMPVMDGLEATKQIRSLTRSDAAKIPIIAMSANAFDDDVKKSLLAGMNAHLAKPINPTELYTELAKWTNRY